MAANTHCGSNTLVDTAPRATCPTAVALLHAPKSLTNVKRASPAKQVPAV